MSETFFEVEEAAAELPKWLTDLRDGVTSPPSSAAGLARQQRLDRMIWDLAACTDLITDCDRYSELMAHAGNPCVTNTVPRIMSKQLTALRARAVARAEQLKADLIVLRKAS